MAAENDELFEPGVTRSRELTDAAQEALKAIDEMAREADGVAGRVGEEGRRR